MTTLTLRPARANETAALTDLALRSKAVWGYDADFLAACRPALTVTGETLGRHDVVVAADPARPLGFYALGRPEPGPSGAVAEIEMFFVDPAAIGRGTGRALWAHLEGAARARAASRLTVLADPDARGFYERMGMRYLRDEPSDVFGRARMLPRLEKEL